MIVVSDASAVIALSIIGRLDILRELFRRETNRLDVIYIGILGVLVEAKRQKLVSKVKPILNQLRDVAGFRISSSLYEYVLDEVGEG